MAEPRPGYICPALALYKTKADCRPDRICPGLLLSGQGLERDADKLTELGVTHVLQIGCRPTHPAGSFTYCSLPIDDAEFSGILNHFDAAFAFIDNALAAGGTVLLHCLAGVSRSASFAAGYLMRKHQLSAAAALAEVRATRPCALPNKGFMCQLLEYEQLCYDVTTWPGWNGDRWLAHPLAGEARALYKELISAHRGQAVGQAVQPEVQEQPQPVTVMGEQQQQQQQPASDADDSPFATMMMTLGSRTGSNGSGATCGAESTSTSTSTSTTSSSSREHAQLSCDLDSGAAAHLGVCNSCSSTSSACFDPQQPARLPLYSSCCGGGTSSTCSDFEAQLSEGFYEELLGLRFAASASVSLTCSGRLLLAAAALSTEPSQPACTPLVLQETVCHTLQSTAQLQSQLSSLDMFPCSPLDCQNAAGLGAAAAAAAGHPLDDDVHAASSNKGADEEGRCVPGDCDVRVADSSGVSLRLEVLLQPYVCSLDSPFSRQVPV